MACITLFRQLNFFQLIDAMISGTNDRYISGVRIELPDCGELKLIYGEPVVSSERSVSVDDDNVIDGSIIKDFLDNPDPQSLILKAEKANIFWKWSWQLKKN